jgi:hypothetical protein
MDDPLSPAEECMLKWGARLAVGGAVAGAVVVVVYLLAFVLAGVTH